MPDRRKSLQSEAQHLGRRAIVLSHDAVICLLRIAVEREGGQSAFAKQHGVDRTHVNRLLSGKRGDMDGAIIKALGLRKAYIIEQDVAKAKAPR